MNNLPKFISIHVPKAGGVTWYYILRQLYGNKLLHDNFMSPANPFYSRILYPKNWDKYSVLHGHFDYAKYNHLPRVTWIRNPIDRVISHYCYWKFSRKRLRNDFYGKIMRERKLDIYQFAELLQNVQTIFIGNNIQKYKFVGILEQFDICLQKFFGIMEINCEIPGYKIKNVNKRIPKDFISGVDRDRIVWFVRKDTEVYELALKWWGF